jgi:very-short-patch-repair endonuclease
VLSPARTLLDLAATSLTDRDIERLVHEAVYVRGLTSIGRLQRLIRRSGRHAGVRTLRRVLKHPEQLKRTGSNPEERLLELIRRAGLPEPRAQVHVLGHPVDFMWPELKLAVEVDTYGTHGSPARFERDRRLDAEILAATGISVLRVTDERIEHEPLAVAATLAATVAARRHGQFRAVDAG